MEEGRLDPAPGKRMSLVAHHGVFPRIAPSAFVADGAYLIGDVDLGAEASVWYNAVLRGDINAIRIGDRTNIQDGTIVHVTRTYPVVIGKEVTVGHQAMVHGCTIEDGALIGMSAVILDHAQVGAQALVAAGALVRQNFVVPPGTLVAGIPARIVRDLTDAELQQGRLAAGRYVQYAHSYRA